jgi:hypothetical protein
MRQLTMHIGTEKTGTTTIQGFLVANRARLRAAGLLVPERLVPPRFGGDSHRFLPAIANDDSYSDEFFRMQGLDTPEARRAAKARWWAAFADEVAQAGTARVIVSSEHLHSRLRRDHEVARLRERLAELFDRIEVVLYIREPVQAAVSLFSTAIKAGGVDSQPPGPEDAYFNNLANHRATIRRWSAVFGPAALRVRVFDRSRFAGGDLLEDFSAACALPACDYQRPKPRNEALSHLGIELMRRVNMALPRYLPNGRLNEARQGIEAVVERHFGTGPRYVAPAALARAYDEAFRESNEWVRARFFPDAERLFPERPAEVGGAPPLPAADLDRIAAMVVELLGRAPSGSPRPAQGPA